MPELMHLGPHQFELRKPSIKKIGQPVAFLGYPLEHMNLTCHAGVISSFYRSGNVNVIQIDASVNPSNSGGPLFDPDAGDVIGIITRKATGLTAMFSALRGALRSNISIIESRPAGDILLGGISFTEALAASQHQMLQTLDQIERSANVGIGYAFSCEHLLEDWKS